MYREHLMSNDDRKDEDDPSWMYSFVALVFNKRFEDEQRTSNEDENDLFQLNFDFIILISVMRINVHTSCSNTEIDDEYFSQVFYSIFLNDEEKRNY